jgi:large subunit ribosomal protein L24
MGSAKAMRVRRDDQVMVISGKDRGKTGRVLRTDPKRRKVFVEGLNIVKRHQRPRSVKDTTRGGQAGGIVEKEGPIDVSNVMLLDPQGQKPTRVGVNRKDGKRVRVARRSGSQID